MTAKRKRFIAGAVCPECQAKDTLAVWQDQGTDNVICVKCGFTQRQTDPAAADKTPAKDRIIGIFDPE
ncbi:YheV family putative zinc ribbon protein [Sodalis sp. C49]|uniref:YheV family putative zinc ribbon protein n=1 Tax=unclassified Sodalis (in: enterobacteria) TaxID=2636512 RepID=UPI00396591FA